MTRITENGRNYAPTRLTYLFVLTTLISLLMALSSLAQNAQASVRPGFFGISPTIATLDLSDIDRMQQIHIGSIRLPIYWRGVQRTENGPYDWSKTDAIVTRAANDNIRVAPFLFGSPSWVSATSTAPPLGSPQARNGWQQFVAAAVSRYGTNGSFWASHPSVNYKPARTWEIWNEENLKAFWGGQNPSPSDYATLLELASTAVHNADPEAKVLVGGLNMPGAGSMPGATYLTQLYGQVPNSVFDAVAVHPYAPTSNEAIGYVGDARRIMDNHGDSAKGIYVTEVGWATSGLGRVVTSLTGQATNLADVYRTLAERHRRWHIRRVTWFTWRDSDPNPGFCTWCTNAGLLTKAGDPKPAFRTFGDLGKRWVKLP